MNKLLLGVLALSTVATFAESKYPDYHGYLDTEVSTTVKNNFNATEKIFENAGKPVEAKAFTGIKLGHTLYKDAKIAVFGGVKGDVYKYTYDAKSSQGSNKVLDIKDYYFGARWDAPITDGFNLALTFANKGIVKDVENKVSGGYTEYKKELDGKSNAGDVLQSLDAKAEEKVVESETVLKNAILKHLEAKGKTASSDDEFENEGYKLHNPEDTTLLSAVLTGNVGGFNSVLGGIYSTRDFKDEKHTLESFVKTSGMAKENVKVEGFLRHELNSKNYDKAGALKGGVTVTTNLNKDLTLKNKAEFDLKNILTKEAGRISHEGEALTENQFKYTGFDKFVVTTDLNYKNEFKTAESLKHIPEFKLGVEYTNGAFKASTNNSDKIEFNQVLPAGTLSDTKNIFVTDNKATYEKDGLKLEGNARYDLNTTFDNNKTHTHAALGKAIVSYTKDNLKYEDYKFTTSVSGAYLLNATNMNFALANGKLTHEVFAYITNDAKFNNVFGLDIDTRLNAYNYIGLTYNDVNAGLATSNPKPTKVGFFLADAGATFTNKADKLTTSLDVNAKYGLNHLTAELKHYGSADATVKADYMVVSNVNLLGEVKGEYSYNQLGGKLYEGLANFVKDNRYADGYRTLPDYLAEKYETKDEHDLVDQYSNVAKNEKKHKLSVKPAVSAVIKFNKLTITPKLGAEFGFEGDNNKFEFKNVSGTGSLTLGYTW